MKILKNFTRVSPNTEEQKKLASNHGAIFLQSDTGEDWYESQDEFQKNTPKIMYDKEGIIRSLSATPDADGHYDVSGFFPEGMSVAEVNILPEGININGEWVFDGEKISPRVYTQQELQQKAEENKLQLLKAATSAIELLADSVALDMATDEEQERLSSWRKYRVLLSRINSANAPNIDWPAPPQ